jgi:hypothetical protein
LPKKEAAASNIDERNLGRAAVYPAFGPCIISDNNWECDRVYLTNTKEDHYILAYRVPSSGARDLVDYQKNAFSGQPNCRKGIGNFKSITMPRDAEVTANVIKFN